MRNFGLSTIVLIAIAAVPGTSYAQYIYDAEPSLSVPTPQEELAETPRTELYSVAINDQRAKQHNARKAVSGLSEHIVQANTLSSLRSLPPTSNGYYVKAGAFQSFENAQQLHADLFAIGSAQITHRQANGRDYYGVYLGPWKTEAEAMSAFGLALDAEMQDGKIIAPH